MGVSRDACEALGDGYMQPGWTVQEGDVTYSTNTIAMLEVLHAAARWIERETFSIAMHEQG